MYRLVLSREAERFYHRCGKPDANKLARCFTALEQDPRVGNLRVVYTINDAEVTVFVITIANRREVYG
jgi:mRNA-degrading endonuclease RelE of RelBE toxin-antitoxin system